MKVGKIADARWRVEILARKDRWIDG
jgi:hypothetical protein